MSSPELAMSRALRVLHLVGMWSTAKGRRGRTLYSAYTCLMCLCYLVFAGFMAASFLLGGRDTSACLEDLGISVAFLPVAFNMATLLARKPRFREVVRGLREFFRRAASVGTRASLASAFSEERTLFVCLPVGSVLGIAFKLTAPLVAYLAQDRRSLNGTAAVVDLPLPLDGFGDVGGAGLAAMYALQSVVYALLFVTFVPTDTFLPVLLLYVAKQFDVLNALIRDVARRVEDEHVPDEGTGSPGENAPVESSDQRKQEEMEDLWRQIVVYHQETLRNAASLCELLRTVLFLHYAVTSVVICMILYQLKAVEGIFLLIYNYCYLGSVLMRLFITNYYATRITTKSLEVSNAVASVQSYGLSRRVKTTMLIIMCRAQKPVYIWAGRFAVMSLETYTSIIHAAYSYYNVLTRMT